MSAFVFGVLGFFLTLLAPNDELVSGSSEDLSRPLEADAKCSQLQVFTCSVTIGSHSASVRSSHPSRLGSSLRSLEIKFKFASMSCSAVYDTGVRSCSPAGLQPHTMWGGFLSMGCGRQRYL